MLSYAVAVISRVSKTDIQLVCSSSLTNFSNSLVIAKQYVHVCIYPLKVLAIYLQNFGSFHPVGKNVEYFIIFSIKYCLSTG